MIKQTESHTYKRDMLTIEEQLHYYEQHPSRNERNAVLWHAWQQNKRWLSQLLELTVASFPAYSRHNASHAKAVLYNIERILGEDRIKKLGQADCFCILHTVYVHDIGMVILSNDREKMVTSDEFSEMLDNLSVGVDRDLKKAAVNLMRRCYHEEKQEELIDRDSEEYLENKKRLYRDKFDTYYSIIQLMSEFQRGHHGENSSSKIIDWISDQDKLRSEFAMSGIPMRIFLRIAECASLHTEWDFQRILDLPFDDDGYGRDMLHPRFIAVLLQLGDALDIDNDRFHPFAQAFLGKLPLQSQAHYDKHMSIRTLKITPEEIRIEADCSSREALRLVRKECDGLERLLQLASYHWSNIAPHKIGGALPTLKTPKLLLQGTEIPQDLAMMKFQISQSKAFSLLQGENIYSGRFPFARELLQNALDSTKIQCWDDYIGSSKFRYTQEKEKSILNVAKIVNPIEYPIEIEIQAGKRNERGIWQEVEFEKIPSSDGEEEEYGILFSIRDYGTGISTQTLRDIANVGTSYKKRKKKLRDLPEWLRPTGEFGIGLQSVFLITDSFYCDTYTRSGERYRIEFGTGASGEQGYINVEPINQEEDPMPFGTKFSVFVSHKRKCIKDEFLEAWHGFDPFDVNYNRDVIRREIVELTSQIVLDIDQQLGEMLFPVYVHVNFPFKESYEKRLQSKLHKITFDTTEKSNKYNEEIMKQKVSWIYRLKDLRKDSFQCYEMKDGLCGFDFENMKLYLWIESISTYARLGVDRLLDETAEKLIVCQIFFKGVKATEMELKGDSALLEMIDIKGGKMPNNYLQLNRNAFTASGVEHITGILVPRILQGAQEAFATVARKRESNGNSDEEHQFSNLVSKYFKQEIINDLNTPRQNTRWHNQLLGVSLFYHFYMMHLPAKTEYYLSQAKTEESEEWTKAIKNVNQIFKNYEAQILKQQKQFTGMSLRISAIEMSRDNTNTHIIHKRETRRISVADFFDRDNQFLIISRRREKGSQWKNYLVLLNGSRGNQLIDRICRSIYNEKIFNRNTELIEESAQYLINNTESIVDEFTGMKQSRFLQKMMKYIPIVGHFSDKEGTTCVNVLSGKSLEYIYYDINSKYLQIQKMVKRHSITNAERFSVFPYYGFAMLGIENTISDICGIQESYIFDSGKRLIFPASGTALEELFHNYSQIDIDEKLLKKKKLIDIGLNFDIKKMDDLYLYSGSMIDLKNESSEEEKIIPLNINEAIDIKYMEFIRSTKRPLNRDKFIENIQRGLKAIVLHNRKKVERTEPLSIPSVENLRLEVQRLRDTILQNCEYVINGGNYIKEKTMIEGTINTLIQNMIRYDIAYEKEIQRQISVQVSSCVEEIKEKYWDDSQEKKKVIDITASYVKRDEEIIEEIYERLWKDIEHVMISIRKQQINLNEYDEEQYE